MPMRLEEGMNLAHRQGNSLLGFLPREHAHLCLRRQYGALHGDGVWVRADLVWQDWITVTPSPADISQAFWSPDGGLVYYVISSAGASLLMARRLDRSRHPPGTPFRVFQFPAQMHPHLYWFVNGADQDEALTALPGRIIGAMAEYSSNIWMMDLPK
jgi:hypothetical protein